MPISDKVKSALASSSMIRKMFEEGLALKKLHGAGNVFDFSLGNPDVEPPPAFHKALAELAAGNIPGLHGYMPNAGYPEVRDILAEKISREHNVALSGRHLVMSVGAAGALNVVFKALLNPGDEVLVSRPYFMEYKAYAANHQGSLVEVEPAENFNLNIPAFKAALSDKTAAVLINSPHNPTGRVYAEETIAALARILNEHGAKTGRVPFLIADEPYRDIIYDGLKTPPVLCAYNNAIAVSSYSKSLSLPGERIGYIAVSPAAEDCGELIDALIYATRTLGFVNAPALMQRCVARLTGETVDVGIYARRRAALKDVLDAAGMSYVEPEGAFYIFAKVPARKGGGTEDDDRAFVEHLKKELILGVPGAGFGTKGWVRFAYCVNEELIKASKTAFLRAMKSWC